MKLVLFFVLFVFSKCSIGKSTTERAIVHKSKVFKGYVLMYGTINKDSVLIVVKKDFVKDNIAAIGCIKLGQLKKVSALPAGNDSIYFTYIILGSNKDLRIRVGSFPPGRQNNEIYSFSDYPYFIETEGQFKKHNCSGK